MTEALESWPYTTLAFSMFGVAFSIVLFGAARWGAPFLNDVAGNTIQRIAKNSAMPILSQLANRSVDLIFAAFALRLLGVTGNGQYAVAVAVWLYVKTISDFGLSVLVVREVARDPSRAGELLGSSTLMRIIVLLAVMPIVVIYVLGGLSIFDLSPVSAIAIALLMISLLPGSYTEAVNSVFNARERMELPAILNVLTNFSRFGFGLAALFAGLGVAGLAAASILATGVSAVAYHLSLRHISVRPVWRLTRQQVVWFASVSWPLLLNALLINLFFRVDVFIIQAVRGDDALGTYDAAYKFINALIILPAYFALAIFPILSRYALEHGERLLNGFRMASKFMLIVAWPITIGTVVLAPFLIRVLGGEAFLPGSSDALRVIIWFLPLNFVNSILQYVLIAANRQRSLSAAFAVAFGFNLTANAIFVPIYGYMASAVITVLTEFVLFVPLAISLRRHVGPPVWTGLLGRPTAAGLAMGGCVLVLLPIIGLIPALAVSGLVYVVSLWYLGVIGRQEIEIAQALLNRD